VSVSGGGGTTCTSGQTYTGSLSGIVSQYQPNGTYYYSPVAGVHRGCLEGPVGTDFDLFLQRWSGFFWSTVARSESADSTEEINYNASVGYYRWRIYSFSGSGPYTFRLLRP
jgi:hypothetical protein